jgi:hypothetical protein
MIGPARDVDEMLTAIDESGGEVIRHTLSVEHGLRLKHRSPARLGSRRGCIV